ncbi:MAG: nuclear transport factor 2 family protein, partial [Terriglobales bacterium]
MTRGIVFLLPVVVWISAVFAYGQAAPASSNHAGANHTDNEQAIRRLNVDVLKAYNLGDVKTLDRIEDSDFVLTGDFGEVTKAQQIDDVGHREANAKSVNVIVANERFRFYGDAALLTEVERYGDGEDFPKFESTSVWVRRGG